ncbi:MAG: hypothetical protein E6614_07905, partial [Bradyrhizobium sp.]|nr:hypothetical protein [Bradyrhizobium sp.]
CDDIHDETSFSGSADGRAGRAADRRRPLRLTRRANQAHLATIEEIIEPAPGDRQRAFCLVAQDFAWRYRICKARRPHFDQI